MSLLVELDAFYTEHRDCGELESDFEGDRVWMTCSCGAVIGRQEDERGSRRWSSSLWCSWCPCKRGPSAPRCGGRIWGGAAPQRGDMVDWSKRAEETADRAHLQSRARQSFVWFLVFLAAALVIFWGGLADKSGWLAALGYLCALLWFGAFLDWVRSRRRLREVPLMRRESEAEARRLLSEEGQADRRMLAKMQNEKTLDLIGMIFPAMGKFLGEQHEGWGRWAENALGVLMVRAETDSVAREFLNDWSQRQPKSVDDLLRLADKWSARMPDKRDRDP